jgi:hypothetical protein
VGLTINGDAAQSGSVLRLTTNVAPPPCPPTCTGQAGTAYWTTPIAFDLTTGFHTAFEFNITTDPGNPTDGFTFLLQNQSANAVGGQGQGSGYVGISPSVAVLFRGRGPAFIGVVQNGVDPLPGSPLGATSVAENSFYNGNEFAWIDYDPFSTTLSVFLGTSSVKPGAAIMSTNVDVFGTLGSQAFVGFSAGSGGGYGDNDILNWSFSSQDTAVPEPASVVLLPLAFLVSLGFARRRLHG